MLYWQPPRSTLNKLSCHIIICINLALHFEVHAGADPGEATWVTAHPYFLDGKFLYFIGFLSLVFPKKSYTAFIVTNSLNCYHRTVTTKLSPHSQNPQDLPLARAINILSKTSALRTGGSAVKEPTH